MRTAFFSAICGAALLLAGGTSLAASAANEAKPEPAKAQLICRAPIDNGLLLTRAKQCYTQAEWDARQKRMQYGIHEIQIRNLQTHN